MAPYSGRSSCVPLTDWQRTNLHERRLSSIDSVMVLMAINTFFTASIEELSEEYYYMNFFPLPQLIAACPAPEFYMRRIVFKENGKGIAK